MEPAGIPLLLGGPLAALGLVLPGWGLANLLEGDERPERSALARWHHRVLLSVGWLSVVGIVLGQLGLFSMVPILVFGGAPALALGRGGIRPSLRRQGCGPSMRDLAVFVLLGAFAIGLGRPTFEDFLGGRDPGVYVAAGHALARDGAIRYRDDLLGELSEAERRLFGTTGTPETGAVGARLAGFYLEDLDRGLVAPQFMPLTATWIGGARLLLGPHAALGVPTLFAFLALLAIYRVGEEMERPEAGLLAAVLTAGCVVQIWFARSHLSEIPFQALAFSALAEAIAWQRVGGRSQLLSAVALATLLAQTRIDAIVVLPPLLGVLGSMVLLQPQPRGLKLALAALLVLGGWVGLTWVTTARIYVIQVLGTQAALSSARLMGLVATAGAMGALAVFWRARLAAGLRWAAPIAQRIAPWVALGVVLLAAWAWGLRPHLARGTQAMSLPKVATYLGTPLTVAAIAGYGWLLARPFELGRALLLATVLPMTALYLQHPRIRLDQFWEMRRFVSIAIPGAILAATLMMSAVARVRVRAWPIGAVAAAVWLLLAGSELAAQARPLLAHVEGQGASALVDELCEAIPSEAVVIADSRYRSPATAQLTVPAAHLCGRQVLELLPGPPDPEVFERMLLRLLEADRPVKLLTAGNMPVFSERVQPRLAQVLEADLVRLEKTFFRPPRARRSELLRAALFDLELGPPETKVALRNGCGLRALPGWFSRHRAWAGRR